MTSYELVELVRSEVAKSLATVGKASRRDAVQVQRIVTRSPGVFCAMDADELGTASPRALAARECKERKIPYGDSDDPVVVLDAFHAGVAHARSQSGARDGRRSSADSAGTSLVDRYIAGKE
jgi:hypothetical protein